MKMVIFLEPTALLWIYLSIWWCCWWDQPIKMMPNLLTTW